MEDIRIKEDFDHKNLKLLGYHFVPVEGGYVSDDGATIVNILRSPYQREVHEYMFNAENRHEVNVQKLREIGALEEI